MQNFHSILSNDSELCLNVHQKERKVLYGSFHIRLTVDVTDLNETIFFASLSTINRHVFFCLGKKSFFASIRFFEFSKKLYFRHSKRTFKPVYLENNCSHEKFSKLRKLWFWLFFTEIVAKKLFKYFLTYKSKEIKAKSFFSKFGPFRNIFFRRLVCMIFSDFVFKIRRIVYKMFIPIFKGHSRAYC